MKRIVETTAYANDLELSEIDIQEWMELELVPEKRTTKGSAAFAAPQLRGWLSLGKPIVRRLKTPDDPDLSSFVYHHVLLATSFRPEEGAPFDRVWLQVLLETDPAGEAIAWSMHPRRESSPIDITRKVGLNAKAGLKWFSSEGKSELESKYTEHEAFLIALNELCSDPVWEFVGTEQVPIMGSQRLHLVVRRTPGSDVKGTVTITATVMHKRFGMFTCKSRVEDTPSLTFAVM